MRPHEIIKYFNKDHWGRGYWEETRGIHWSAFRELLLPHYSNLTQSQYSRLRSNEQTKKETPLTQALKHPDVIKRIEFKLDCPGLFACKTKEELEAYLGRLAFDRQAITAPSSRVDVLIVPDTRVVDEMLVCAKEDRIAERLVGFLERRGGILGAWPELPRLGASLIAYVAASRRMSKDGVTNYLIRPFSNDAGAYLKPIKTEQLREIPFDNAIRALKIELGLPEATTMSQLIDRLIERGSTLFVLNADVLQTRQDRYSLMNILLATAESRSERTAKYLPIMLLGAPSRERHISTNRTFEGVSKLEFSAEAERERDEFFETQWRRFCRLRGIQLGAEAGSSRLKRVRRYYSSDTKSSSWPSTVRVQAFFASNHKTFSYFDPTAGWTALAGMPADELPLDIRLHLDEAVHQLRAVREDGKRNPAPRALQWCSTAVYWFTADAANDLGKELTPPTPLKTFEIAIKDLNNGLVEVHEESDQTVYKMDLGMRAAIQDRWIQKDPLGRAKTHHQIAWRLYRSSNDKRLLSLEFPIQPHWGRSRLHLLSECIRHLIRSCDYSHRVVEPVSFQAEGQEIFPLAPSKQVPPSPVPLQKDDTWRSAQPQSSSNQGCNPYEVINFCFGQLFWRELNGHMKPTHHLNRKLSLQHGAYHLTAELLQLMSEDGKLGAPHWALNPVYVSRYLREVAFSQLDLGDLTGAKQTFEKLISSARSDAMSVLDAIDFKLDLTVVLASMDDLTGASEVLQAASHRLDSFEPSYGTDQSRVSQLKIRVWARRAHLSYLDGNIEDALKQCQHIEHESPGSLVRDAAHTYISALGASGDKRNLELATRVCLRQLFDNTSKGLHHEALGFRVSLGHIMRKLGFLGAAEEALDGAYSDIIQYGCSERTYIAMLLEAGRILYYQGRYVRAYAAYLRPCLDRAISRGYARPARHARDYANKCLNELLARVPEEGWPDAQLKAQAKAHGEYLQSKRSERIDPLHSYDPTEIERWLPRLHSREALLDELRQLDQ